MWLRPPDSQAACGVVLVGPGRHFGLELIEKFVAGGCRVGVITASQTTLIELRHQLSCYHDSVVLKRADAAHPREFAQSLSELAVTLGRVDGLIYNPKYGAKGTGLLTEPEELEHSLSVNITGAMVAVQALLPFLRTHRGRVILTGGGYKDRPDAGKFALSVGKAGIHGLFKALRDPLRNEGVDVSTIVIDGAVRRHGMLGAPAADLADFYWDVFSHRGGRVHRFPERQSADDQLSLFP